MRTWLILISKTPKRKNSNQLMPLRKTSKYRKRKRLGKKKSPTGNSILVIVSVFSYCILFSMSAKIRMPLYKIIVVKPPKPYTLTTWKLPYILAAKIFQTAPKILINFHRIQNMDLLEVLQTVNQMKWKHHELLS